MVMQSSFVGGLNRRVYCDIQRLEPVRAARWERQQGDAVRLTGAHGLQRDVGRVIIPEERDGVVLPRFCVADDV